jgi:hypothetical protein
MHTIDHVHCGKLWEQRLQHVFMERVGLSVAAASCCLASS